MHSTAPPNITVFNAPEVVESGSSSTLQCVAAGTPTPQITWFREEKPLRNSSHVVISTNPSSDKMQSIVQLLVLTEEDSGEYSCQANSSNYVVVKSIYIYVEGIGLQGQSKQGMLKVQIIYLFGTILASSKFSLLIFIVEIQS